MKVVQLTIKNRAAAIGITFLILALGAILIMFGMMLLAGLAVAGAAIGTGVAIYRRLRLGGNRSAAGRFTGNSRLDPSLEVQPAQPPIVTLPRVDDK